MKSFYFPTGIEVGLGRLVCGPDPGGGPLGFPSAINAIGAAMVSNNVITIRHFFTVNSPFVDWLAL